MTFCLTTQSVRNETKDNIELEQVGFNFLEWMKEWMNDWMIERMNEWISGDKRRSLDDTHFFVLFLLQPNMQVRLKMVRNAHALQSRHIQFHFTIQAFFRFLFSRICFLFISLFQTDNGLSLRRQWRWQSGDIHELERERKSIQN